MESLFSSVLSMAISASVAIVVVLCVRVFLKGAPKKWSYLLWSVVAFRLCFPISLKSVLSVYSIIPTQVQKAQSAISGMPASTASGTLAPLPAGDVQLPAAELDPNISAASAPDWLFIGAIVWLIGIAALLLYSVVRYHRLHSILLDAVCVEGNVFETDRISSPFIMGLFVPRIYIPLHLDGDRLRYVLLHERYHLHRRDHWVKTFSFLLLAAYWFHPLCWLAYYLMSRDMELSCDEYVLSCNAAEGVGYSESLLSFAVPHRMASPGLLAFGESDIALRVKNALRWKRPKPLATITALVLALAVLAACATDPETAVPEETAIPASEQDLLPLALKRMQEVKDSDFVLVQGLSELPSTGLGEILNYAADHAADDLPDMEHWYQWVWYVNAYLSHSPDGTDDELFQFRVWLESPKVWVTYTANRQSVTYMVEDQALYAFVRGSYHFEASVDKMELRRWQPILESLIESYGVDESLYRSHEICYFEKDEAHSFDLDGDHYTLYRWDVRFQPVDPARVIFAGGMVMDENCMVYALIHDPGILAVKNDTEYRFISDGYAFDREEGRRAVAEAFLARADWHERGIEVVYGSSEHYSRAEVGAALDTVMQYFDQHFPGCTMQRIAYESDGDAQTVAWLNEHRNIPGAGSFAESICFLSDYHTPPESQMANHSLNPDSDYTNWAWWLARTDGGNWVVVDMGY